MDQSSLNWFFGLINLVLGVVMKMIWDSYKSLKEADKELAEKVGNIEVLVAGQYVKREDFAQVTNQLFFKLDKILDKLDTKADK
jgi:hypothetical protein